MCTVEIPNTGAVFLWSIVLKVPGQQLHEVIRGTKAALALNGFCKTNWEKQCFMESTAEIGVAVILVLTGAASISSGSILSTLTPNTHQVITALHIPGAWHIKSFTGHTFGAIYLREAVSVSPAVTISGAAMRNIVVQVLEVVRCSVYVLRRRADRLNGVSRNSFI